MRTNAAEKTNEIIHGVIWKQLLFFFFPILLGSFFQQLYNTADAVIVGRFLGKEALAAVGGSAGMIIALIVGFFTGLTSGASVIVSQFFGCGDKKGVNNSVHTLYALSAAGSILITVTGIATTRMSLAAMNTPGELMKDSILYLNIYYGGIFFTFIYNTGSAILRALGDSRRPLYSLIVCCIINIILDLLFIGILGMGVSGAAIATVIAQAISAFMVTWYLLRSPKLCQFSLRRIRFHGASLKSELLLGLPGGMQYAMYSISNIIIQAALNTFGTDTAAAWAAYGKMDSLFWMVSSACGLAITTFVGQNYGAGQMHRVRKSIRVCLWMDLGVSVFMSLFFIVLRIPLFHIFIDDAAVVEIGTQMLWMMTPFYATFVLTEVLSGALRGMGDVIIPTIITVGGICVLRIAWIFLAVPLCPTLSFTLVNYPLSWMLTSVLFLIYYIIRIKKLSVSHFEPSQDKKTNPFNSAT